MRLHPSLLPASLAALLIVLGAGQARAQEGTERFYRLYLRDKGATPHQLSNPQGFLTQRALDRRARYGIAIDSADLPVPAAYIALAQAEGATVIHASRWHNALTVRADSLTHLKLLALAMVTKVEAANKNAMGKKGTGDGPDLLMDDSNEPSPDSLGEEALDATHYGASFTQIDQAGGTSLHAMGFMGQGMHIAVMDAGFTKVDTDPLLKHLFLEGRILGTHDFVGIDSNVFSQSGHGSACLGILAANVPGVAVGACPKASYYLYRTEAMREAPVEEDHWVAAAERADSLGVDVLTTSLGYNTFDTPELNYTVEDLDGRTSFISRGALWASRKGMLVINSAGNEGKSIPWQGRVTMPADADSILTVGSVDALGVLSAFSSRGPTADGRIKPDVVMMGSNVAVTNGQGGVGFGSGTSYSGPAAAGLAACLWQAHREMTPWAILDLIRNCASQANSPDNQYGWGIPDFACSLYGTHGEPTVRGQLDNYFNVVQSPFHDVLQVNYHTVEARDVTVRLFDAAGRTVYDATFGAQAASVNAWSLPLGHLPDGTYVLRATAPANGTTAERVALDAIHRIVKAN